MADQHNYDVKDLYGTKHMKYSYNK